MRAELPPIAPCLWGRGGGRGGVAQVVIVWGATLALPGNATGFRPTSRCLAKNSSKGQCVSLGTGVGGQVRARRVSLPNLTILDTQALVNGPVLCIIIPPLPPRQIADEEMFGDIFTARLLAWTNVTHSPARNLHNAWCRDFVKCELVTLSAAIAQHRASASQMFAWGGLFGDLDRLGASAATCGALSRYKCV